MSAIDTLPSLDSIKKALDATLSELALRGIPDVNDKLRALTYISIRQGERLLQGNYPRALMCVALADASYAAMGARNALAAVGIAIPEIAPAVKRSKESLLAIAGLGEPALRGVQRLFVDMYGGDESAIPSGALIVSSTPVTSVAFTEAALFEINGCLEPGRGCPARGEIMDRFFDSFVDVVLI